MENFLKAMVSGRLPMEIVFAAANREFAAADDWYFFLSAPGLFVTVRIRFVPRPRAGDDFFDFGKLRIPA